MTQVDDRDDQEERGEDLLLFRIGTERFATPLGAVEEAVDLEEDAVQGVPSESPSLRGVFTVRGALVPLFVADRALGVATRDGRTALVARSAAGARIALAVDDVEDVLTVHEDELRASGPAADADTIVRGVVHRGSAIIAIVNFDALVAACRATDPGETS